VPDQTPDVSGFGKIKDPLPDPSPDPLVDDPNVGGEGDGLGVAGLAGADIPEDDIVEIIENILDEDGFLLSTVTPGVPFFGGDVNDNVTGSSGDDFIDGGGGNDILLGGAGNDVVIGGPGNDTLIAGSGEGNDSYDGGDDSDSLVYPSTSLGIAVTVNTTPRSGSVTGSEIDSDTFVNIETIVGGSGDDSFVVGSVGGMHFDGGAGSGDTLSYANTSSALTVDLGANTVTKGTLSSVVTDTFTSFESFTGGAGGDIINGSGGNDDINGGGGNDTIFGSTGSDVIDGGSGFNILRYDGISGIQINFETGTVTGAGFIDTFTNINQVLGVTGDVNVVGGNGDENFGGGEGNDTIFGGGGNDTIFGADGNDTLTGGAGDDIISGGAGNDVLDGGAGVDVQEGGSGDDRLVFDVADTTIIGGTGDDTLVADSATSTLDETALANVSGVENVDLNDNGGHTLILTASVVDDLSDTGTLTVTGDAVDAVQTDDAWFDDGQVDIDEVTFNQFSQGGNVLLVEDGVDDSGIQRVGANESILSDLDGNNGFRITGEAAGDTLGASVSLAGDVNGDGFEDIIVGAKSNSAGGNEAGAAYVVFGAAGGFSASVDASSLAAGVGGFRITGEFSGDYAGAAVGAAGDVNGDGIDDFIVGATNAGANGYNGAAFVVFGTNGNPGGVDLGNLDGTNGFRLTGENGDDYAGFSVSSAGDFNGDGIGDLLIGAPGYDVGTYN